MRQISPLEKEIRFLYNKHNKSTKYPLEMKKIDFPLYIKKILLKETKKTNLEKKKLEKYRNKLLYDLSLESLHLEQRNKEKLTQKRKEKQQKISKNKEIKYQTDNTKIKHFGIWFTNDEKAKLNRENYAVIDKKVHSKVGTRMLDWYKKNPMERMKIYEDEQCTIYAGGWCIRHQQDCLKNFDLNINYFSKLEKDKFEHSLSLLLKRRKGFKQIYDINDLEEISGIYILILDEYKQIYIGQSKNIKKEILAHWRKKKYFDKLIFGTVESSIISIESFGFLDTTRIFAIKAEKEWELNDIEKTLIGLMNKKYLLNRTSGGICGNDCYAQLEIINNRNKRKLCRH